MFWLLQSVWSKGFEYWLAIACLYNSGVATPGPARARPGQLRSGARAIIGATLSEPHTSVTALQDTCVCLSVCLSVCLRTYVRPYTENFNWTNGNEGTRTFQS